MNASAQIAALFSEADNLHRKIERDHEQVGSGASATLVAAWFAGKHLHEAKSLLHSERGHGHWEAYAGKSFSGSLVTATRYMKLHKSFRDMKDLPTMSLHQTYVMLRMLTRKSNAVKSNGSASPCDHLFHARKVIAHVRKALGEGESASVEKLRGDLYPLRAELRRLYGEYESTS